MGASFLAIPTLQVGRLVRSHRRLVAELGQEPMTLALE